MSPKCQAVAYLSKLDGEMPSLIQPKEVNMKFSGGAGCQTKVDINLNQSS